MYRPRYTVSECSEATKASTFLRLSTPEFASFIRFLEERLNAARETLETRTDPADLYRAQGRCLEIEALFETIDAYRKKARTLG